MSERNVENQALKLRQGNMKPPKIMKEGRESL